MDPNCNWSNSSTLPISGAVSFFGSKSNGGGNGSGVNSNGVALDNGKSGESFGTGNGHLVRTQPHTTAGGTNGASLSCGSNWYHHRQRVRCRPQYMGNNGNWRNQEGRGNSSPWKGFGAGESGNTNNTRVWSNNGNSAVNILIKLAFFCGIMLAFTLLMAYA